MNNNSGRPSVLVLGIGNILLGDEGIGVRVLEALQRIALPYDVELIDGGTAGADLLDVLSDRRKVIVIDAIDADCAPGTILRLMINDFNISDSRGTSLHEVGLLATLAMARHLGSAPEEVILIGVVPYKLDLDLELSVELKGLIPEIVQHVLAELKEVTEIHG